jgi:hypothetical protein
MRVLATRVVERGGNAPSALASSECVVCGDDGDGPD